MAALADRVDGRRLRPERVHRQLPRGAAGGHRRQGRRPGDRRAAGGAEEAPAAAVDLMAALRASVERATAARGERPARPRRPPRRRPVGRSHADRRPKSAKAAKKAPAKKARGEEGRRPRRRREEGRPAKKTTAKKGAKKAPAGRASPRRRLAAEGRAGRARRPASRRSRGWRRRSKSSTVADASVQKQAIGSVEPGDARPRVGRDERKQVDPAPARRRRARWSAWQRLCPLRGPSTAKPSIDVVHRPDAQGSTAPWPRPDASAPADPPRAAARRSMRIFAAMPDALRRLLDILAAVRHRHPVSADARAHTTDGDTQASTAPDDSSSAIFSRPVHPSICVTTSRSPSGVLARTASCRTCRRWSSAPPR